MATVGFAQLPEAPEDPTEAVPDQIEVPFQGIQTIYAEDFAEDDGGYETAGTDAWEFGEADAPPEVPSGSTPNVWGTTLDDDYGDDECSYLDTGAIDLSGAPAGSAYLSMDHWFDIEISSFSGTAWDGGMLQVSTDGESWETIDPVGGYPSDGAFSDVEDCFGIDGDEQSVFSGESDGWEQAQFDVSDYVGGDLHVRFAFASDGFTEERGWYLDNVAVELGVGASADVPDTPGIEELDTLLEDTVPDEATVPFTPLTTLYGEDFAEDDGGYETTGTDTWEFGEPDAPPEVPAGSTPDVWGTNLDGDYAGSDCAFLDTGAIDLSGAPAGTAYLSFDHWMHSDISSFSGALDGGLVMVSADGESWQAIDPVGGYSTDEIGFSMESCLGIDGDEQGAFATADDEPFEEWQTAQFDVSDYLGGDLHVRFAFASSSFTEERGWYLDNVAVELGVGASADVPDVGVPEDPTEELPVDTGADAPLWTSGGEDSSWEYGTVTDDSSYADEIRGENGYMTNLAGDTNDPECSWIQSPEIPGAVLESDPTLSFDHAYRIPGGFVDVAWGGGMVMVSDDGGSSWDYLDLPEYDRPLDYSGGIPECFTGHGAPLDGDVFSGPHLDEIETVDVDLSDYANATTVQVRFVFGTTTFAYEGWFVDSVRMGGQDILLDAPVGGIGGGLPS